MARLLLNPVAMGMRLDVACWNLAVAGAALTSGCSGGGGGETAGGDGSSGAETEVGESEEPGGPDGPSDPSEPECWNADDCGGSFYSCEDGKCVDNWDDCNDYEDLEGCRDSEDTQEGDTDGPVPECSDDPDCARDEWCNPEGSCAPLAIPVPCDGDVSLTFTPVLETPEDITRFELVGPPGDAVIITMGPNSEGQTGVFVVAVATGEVTAVPTTILPTAFTGGDIDGDGDVDVVTSRDGTTTIFEQTESGAFDAVGEVEWGGNFSWIGIAGTAGADAAIVGVRQERVWRMAPQGRFSYADPLPITPAGEADPGLAVLGEFDGVGREDVAWIGQVGTGVQAHHFRLDGDERASYLAQSGASMHAADAQGDGVDDLLLIASDPRDVGRSRVDVVLPDPVAGGVGRAVVDHEGWGLLESGAADIDGDGGGDVVLLVGAGEEAVPQLVYARALLADVACTSTQTLERAYDAMRTLQHPDGSGWVVMHGPAGFVAAPL